MKKLLSVLLALCLLLGGLSAPGLAEGAPVVTLDAEGRSAATESFAGFRARVSLVLDNNGVSGLLVTEAVINEDGTILIPLFQVPGVSVMAVCAALVPAGEEPVRPDPTVAAYDWRLLGGGFAYIHDPRDNPGAMQDIVEDPDAVYGFSPDPASARLGSYAAYDWSDPALVAQATAERRAYHVSLGTMTEMVTRMQAEGAATETIARAVSAERNRLRLAAYEGDPVRLAEVRQSNLEAYGNEDGPTPDALYEKYGSWEMVLQKSFSPNLGMDVCCGLYDEYYPLYIALGLAEG